MTPPAGPTDPGPAFAGPQGRQLHGTARNDHPGRPDRKRRSHGRRRPGDARTGRGHETRRPQGTAHLQGQGRGRLRRQYGRRLHPFRALRGQAGGIRRQHRPGQRRTGQGLAQGQVSAPPGGHAHRGRRRQRAHALGQRRRHRAR